MNDISIDEPTEIRDSDVKATAMNDDQPSASQHAGLSNTISDVAETVEAPANTTTEESKLMEKLQSEGLLSPRPGGKSPGSITKRRDTSKKPSSTEISKNYVKDEKFMTEPATVSNLNKEVEIVASLSNLEDDSKNEDSPSSKEKEEEVEKKKKKRDRSQAASIVCTFKDPSGKDVVCKQRAILGYVFCIRHILNDPEAPYLQCEHQRKPKNKNDTNTRCTNAIRKDRGETYCSTHMIMQGLKESKKKPTTGGIDNSLDRNSSTPDASTFSQPQPPPAHLPNSDIVHISAASGSSDDSNSKSVPSALQSALAAHPSSLAGPVPGLPLSVVAPGRTAQRMAVQVRISPEQVPSDPSPSTRIPAAVVVGHHQVIPPNQAQLPPHSAGSTVGTVVAQAEQSHNPLSNTESSLPITTNQNQGGQKVQQLTPEQCEETIARMTPQQRAAFEQHRMVQAARRRALSQQFATRPLSGQQNHSNQQKKPAPAFLPRLDRILARLSPRAKEVWAMSLASRLGVSLRQSRPFSFQTLSRYNPSLAQRIHQGAKYRSFRPMFRGPASQDDLRPLSCTAPPIRAQSPDSLSDEDETPPKKVIRLRQKRQQQRMVGPYREIPLINPMCKVLEEADFDQTDLFPFGLEPSDDEDDAIFTGTPSSVFLPTSMDLEAENPEVLTELYLIKKQLRLERCALLKAAQINAPVMTAAKKYPTSVGAALRQRLQGDPPPPQALLNTIRRCHAVENKIRCERACLPSSNHCCQHVLYNVNQRMFSYCTASFCSRPVLCVDAFLWDGKCTLHRDSRREKYGEFPFYPDLIQESSPNSPVTSRSVSAAEGEDTDHDDTVESPLADEPLSPVSVGTP